MQKLLKATAAKVVKDTVPDAVDPAVDVLPRCPYHDQIIMVRTARDTFVESQALLDFQEYFVRKEIADRQKAVGIEEVIYKEDMRSFFGGLVRTFEGYKDLILDTKTLIFSSNNWRIMWKRAKNINPAMFGMQAFATYNRVLALYKDGEYEAAGEAFSSGLFPEHFSTWEGSVEWEPLPYEDPTPKGVEAAGIVGGVLTGLTGTKDTRFLSDCLADQDTIVEIFDDITSDLYNRYNADILSAVTKANSFFADLETYTKECPESTQEIIAQAVEMSEAATLDEITILTNVRDNKDHLELGMAKMKMQSSVHDFYELGFTFTDVYATMIGH